MSEWCLVYVDDWVFAIWDYTGQARSILWLMMPRGCFANSSRALQNKLAKIHNARNHISGENFILKLCKCAQSMVWVLITGDYFSSLNPASLLHTPPITIANSYFLCMNYSQYEWLNPYENFSETNCNKISQSHLLHCLIITNRTKPKKWWLQGSELI